MNIKSYIENDGFIYCIINNTNLCKIGKIGTKCTEEITLTTLLNRYSTYFPDCKIYKFQRVSDYHNAEIEIFKLLTSCHYKKEHFYFDEKLITDAFNEIKLKYPDINTIIINTEIDKLSDINKKLRQL